MSLAGIQNPFFLPAVYSPASDVTVTAGTPVILATTTTAVIAKNAGGYYPILFCTVASLQGATAATALVYSFRIHSGTDISTYTVTPSQLTNNANLVHGFVLIGVESQSAWYPTGSIIELWGSATTQNVTVKQVGTQFLLALGVGANP